MLHVIDSDHTLRASDGDIYLVDASKQSIRCVLPEPLTDAIRITIARFDMISANMGTLTCVPTTEIMVAAGDSRTMGHLVPFDTIQLASKGRKWWRIVSNNTWFLPPIGPQGDRGVPGIAGERGPQGERGDTGYLRQWTSWRIFERENDAPQANARTALQRKIGVLAAHIGNATQELKVLTAQCQQLMLEFEATSTTNDHPIDKVDPDKPPTGHH